MKTFSLFYRVFLSGNLHSVKVILSSPPPPLSIYLPKHVVRECVVTVVCMDVCRCSVLDKDARAKSPNKNITEMWKLREQEASFLMSPSINVL